MIPAGTPDTTEAYLRHCYVAPRSTVGLVLFEPYAPEVAAAIDDYLYAIDHLHQTCQSHQAQLVFAYDPCFPQIYDPKASLKIRNLLEKACRDLAIPFLDLTPALRLAGQREKLHLLPRDFHYNAAGYRVIAEALAGVLPSLAGLPLQRRPPREGTRRRAFPVEKP